MMLIFVDESMQRNKSTDDHVIAQPRTPVPDYWMTKHKFCIHTILALYSL